MGTNKLDPWYVTGLVDGEGSFTFSRSGKNICLYFAIKLSKKDRGLLEEISEFFGGAGNIYSVKGAFHKNSTSYSKETSYFRVSKLDDLKYIISHFERYPLRGRRGFFYQVWRDMFLKKLQFKRRKQPEELEILAGILSEQDPKRGIR